MAKRNKVDRWNSDASDARSALEDLMSFVKGLTSTQAEVEASYDNMGDGLRSTERGQSYELIIDVDLGKAKEAIDVLDGIISDAESAA